jgi:hypothetical protein
MRNFQEFDIFLTCQTIYSFSLLYNCIKHYSLFFSPSHRWLHARENVEDLFFSKLPKFYPVQYQTFGGMFVTFLKEIEDNNSIW